MSQQQQLTPDLSHLVDGLTSDPETWTNSSLASVTQLTPSGLSLLCSTAQQMRNLVKKPNGGGDDRLKHKILASVFYEASTRTSCSFQTAMMRLGGNVIHIDAGSGGNTSASKKGETLSDTIRCLQCYTDVTVLRHNVTGSVGDIVVNGGLDKPVLNAGDGVGEHPTQALLDLFTIVDELGMLGDDSNDNSNNNDDDESPLVVVLLGDLKHGRTVHSLAKLLARSQSGFLKRDLILRYCSPPSLQMPQYVKDYVKTYVNADTTNIIQQEFSSVEEAIKGANVLYVTRVQKERFDNMDDYNAVKGAYVVDANLMAKAPSDKMIVMHPLPRVDEIAQEVDADPRAAYFREMENGLYVRMALLALVLGKASA